MQPRILVIEDNEQNRYLLSVILGSQGCAVLEAATGRAGIDAAIRDLPSLILLDIQLPEMDGFAVLRELRGHAALDEVPIIAVTSHAMIGDRERILAAGCSDYIEKPIDPDTFMEQVRRHLRMPAAEGS